MVCGIDRQCRSQKSSVIDGKVTWENWDTVRTPGSQCWAPSEQNPRQMFVHEVLVRKHINGSLCTTTARPWKNPSFSPKKSMQAAQPERNVWGRVQIQMHHGLEDQQEKKQTRTGTDRCQKHGLQECWSPAGRSTLDPARMPLLRYHSSQTGADSGHLVNEYQTLRALLGQSSHRDLGAMTPPPAHEATGA